ncbi:MAG: serine protease [Sphingorhabdus sp.]
MRILLALLLIILPVSFAPALGEATDINAATRSVVRVAVFSSSEGQRTFIGHGSGVVVAPNKVVTNAHVVDPAQYDESVTFVIIPSEGSQSYEATIIASAPSKDLALLQITGAQLTPAALYSGIVGDGSDVFAIGYPANVDIALEQNEEDTLHPQMPVKTRGSVSSGRTSKNVDSLLHTAPIAPGNSGGPLVDACGRVIGINSFGSVSDGGGAEFYFAISVRELSNFLRTQNVNFSAASSECRSVAEMTRAEAEREAAARAKIEAENRIATELRTGKEGKFRSDAEHDIIAERENHIALAALLLVLGAVGGGAAWQFSERKQREQMKIAASVAGVLTFSAFMIFALRPSFKEVDDRVRAAMTPDDQRAKGPATTTIAGAGKKHCVIQPDRSRITVSDTADVTFGWADNGCINGRTQYADDAGKWSRSFVPNNEQQVSLVSYAPDTKTYRIERYLLGMDAMQKAREARRLHDTKTCSADPAIREKISNMNKAVREVLPTTPNELLVFSCSDE